MAEDTERKKLFEELLGHELEEGDFPTEVLVRETHGLNTEDYKAEAVSRDIGTTGGSTKSCSRTSVMDVSGIIRVDQSGVVKFRLSDYFCRPLGHTEGRDFHRPIVFVATPRGSRPIFVTSVPKLVVGGGVDQYGNDVEIEAFTWDAAGKATGPVVLQFRCIVGFRSVEG